MIPAEYGADVALVCMAADFAAALMAGDIDAEAAALRGMASVKYIAECGGIGAIPAAVSRLIEALEAAPDA